jgi:hypothetical protein
MKHGWLKKPKPVHAATQTPNLRIIGGSNNDIPRRK